MSPRPDGNPRTPRYNELYDRILRKVDEVAYLPLVDQVEPGQREALGAYEALLRSPDFSADAARALVRRLSAEGRIDRVVALSCLHAIEAHPRVKNYAEAARLVGEQELAALEMGGPSLGRNLASVDRHRGVLAFLLGNYDVALDYFSRTFERERSAGNLSNVLATLLRLGEEEEARELLAQVRGSLPRPLVAALLDLIRLDPDLALLRTEIHP